MLAKRGSKGKIPKGTKVPFAAIRKHHADGGTMGYLHAEMLQGMTDSEIREQFVSTKERTHTIISIDPGIVIVVVVIMFVLYN